MPEEDSGESFTTLCHGEPWIGNAMFQYKPNKPDEQRPGNSGEQATKQAKTDAVDSAQPAAQNKN